MTTKEMRKISSKHTKVTRGDFDCYALHAANNTGCLTDNCSINCTHPFKEHNTCRYTSSYVTKVQKPALAIYDHQYLNMRNQL